MRISDWSSDVCSSDLQGGARSARLQGATGRQHAADQPLMARAPRDRAQSQIALPLDWNAGGANDGPLIVGTSNAAAVRYLRHVSTWPVRPAVQIGRASCREIVCQYV